MSLSSGHPEDPATPQQPAPAPHVPQAEASQGLSQPPLDQVPGAGQPPVAQQWPQEPAAQLAAMQPPTAAGSVPQPAWARPATQVQWVETEALEYHQLLRGVPRFRWWKPVLGLILGVLYYIALSTGFALLVFSFAAVSSGGSLDQDAMLELAIPDTQNPFSMVMTLGSIALMIPSALLAMLSVGLSPAGRLWSAALRIRWRWIWRSVVPAIVALFVINAVGIVLSIIVSSAIGESSEITESAPADFSVNAALWSVLIILLLVPLQSSAEELIFRGAFMQAIGAWRNHIWFFVLIAVAVPLIALSFYLSGGVEGLLEQGGRVLIVSALVFGAAALMKWRTGSPLIAVGLPSVAFAFAHIYEIWGMLSVASMALVAAWLTWRTGGLEAAITLHIVNNLVGFLMMTFAYGGETAQTADGGNVISLVASVLGQVLFAWWIDRDFRRVDGRRTRIDRVQRIVPSVQTPQSVQPNGSVAA